MSVDQVGQDLAEVGRPGIVQIAVDSPLMMVVMMRPMGGHRGGHADLEDTDTKQSSSARRGPVIPAGPQ